MSPFLILWLVFAAILCLITGSIILRRLAESRRNNRLPIQSGPATVVAKREVDVSSQYGKAFIRYVTFAMPDGSRQMFETQDRDRDLVIGLTEGDHGTLTWQGTRFRGFDPIRNL